VIAGGESHQHQFEVQIEVDAGLALVIGGRTRSIITKAGDAETLTIALCALSSDLL
jgi:hypothetical protein